jgi:glucose-1-phosphate thymidylyltransferase
MMISYPEEIAYRMGYIDSADLSRLALAMDSNHYGLYLLRLAESEGIIFHRE